MLYIILHYIDSYYYENFLKKIILLDCRILNTVFKVEKLFKKIGEQKQNQNNSIKILFLYLWLLSK